MRTRRTISRRFRIFASFLYSAHRDPTQQGVGGGKPPPTLPSHKAQIPNGCSGCLGTSTVRDVLAPGPLRPTAAVELSVLPPTARPGIRLDASELPQGGTKNASQHTDDRGAPIGAFSGPSPFRFLRLFVAKNSTPFTDHCSASLAPSPPTRSPHCFQTSDLAVSGTSHGCAGNGR